MTGLNPVLIGAVVILASAAIAATAVLSQRSRAVFVYAQLMLMAGIYLGFAVSAMDAKDFITRADWSVLTVESIVALGLMLGGLAVMNSARVWLLGVLVLVHGGIDLLHLVMGAAHSPDWYEFICLIYDAIVGVAAIWLLSEKPAAV